MFLIFLGVFICLQVSEAVLMNGIFTEFICSFQIVKMCLSFFSLPWPPAWVSSEETYSTVLVSSGFPWSVSPHATVIKILKWGTGFCEVNGRATRGWIHSRWVSLGWQGLAQQRWSSMSIPYVIFYREEHLLPMTVGTFEWDAWEDWELYSHFVKFLNGITINRG